MLISPEYPLTLDELKHALSIPHDRDDARLIRLAKGASEIVERRHGCAVATDIIGLVARWHSRSPVPHARDCV